MAKATVGAGFNGIGPAVGTVLAGLILIGCAPSQTQGGVIPSASAVPAATVDPSPSGSASPSPFPLASPGSGCRSGGSDPSPRPTSTPTAAATARPSGAPGTITGSAGFGPPSGVAAQLIYAVSTSGASYGAYATEVVAGQFSYSIKGVAPGAYYVFSAVRPLVCTGQGTVLGAPYSRFVKCGGSPTCGTHDPVEVIVTAGATTEEVHPNDWFRSDKSVPAPPIQIVTDPAPPFAGRTFASAREAAIATARTHAQAVVVASVDTCPVNRACISIGNQHDGTRAAYFDGEGGSNGDRLACLTYVAHDAAGWRGVRSQCPAAFPAVGKDGMVWLGGVTPGRCGANVRSAPGPSGKVIACVQHHTAVAIDAGPVYVPMSATDGLWWHLKGRGWMADNFLIFPEICGCD